MIKTWNGNEYIFIFLNKKGTKPLSEPILAQFTDE